MLKFREREKEEHVFNINQTVLNKIRNEEKNHPFREFGGWLLVQDGEVKDVVFDVQFASGGSVDFGVGIVKAVDSKHRRMVRGWFHKHPMVGLSGTDEGTLVDLTKFWKECYTMVLQSDGKMLLMKTVPTTKQKNENQLQSQQPNTNKNAFQNEPESFYPSKASRSFLYRFLNNFKNTTKYVDSIVTNSPPVITTEQRQIGQPGQQAPNNIFGYGWNQWRSPMNDVDIVFKNEIPFGVTQFTPEYDNQNRKFRLYSPKMECMSEELAFGDLIESNAFRFYSKTASYTFDRAQLVSLLRKGQLNILMFSGVISMDEHSLYEGDVVSFITPWNNIEQQGNIIFHGGKWGINVESDKLLSKILKKTSVIDLDDRVLLKFLHNMMGGI